MKLYASLVNSLLGTYYPLPTEDNITARLMLNSSGLKKMWCSVYDEAEVDRQIEQFGGLKLPDEYARRLDYDHDELRDRLVPVNVGNVDIQA